MECEYETVREEDSEPSKILLSNCAPGCRTGYLRFGPERVVLPKYYLEFKDAIDNFEVRPDDTWVVSYPKAGTTWTQELVWCVGNDLNFVGAKQKLSQRFPFLELSSLFEKPSVPEEQSDVIELRQGYEGTDSLSFTAQLKSPRFIKTHLPWQMLPKQLQENTKKAKIVHVARNAKDNCLSQYHHSVTLGTFAGDFETFSQLFLGDTIVYAPFWSHVLSYWNRRHDTNILLLQYEDMKKDLPAVIRQTADFLGKTLTESQVAILADHLSFAKMKVNPAVNYEANSKPGQLPFMRRGEVDQWKTDLSPELVEKFDRWINKNVEGTDLSF